MKKERNKEFGKEKVKCENHVTKHAVPQTEQERSNSTCFMQYHKLSKNEATVHVLCSTTN